MSEIIPAILAKDVSDLEQKISELPEEIEIIHLDMLEEDIWVELKHNFEVHLMLADPGTVCHKWLNRGAKRLIVHKLDDKILAEKGAVEIGLGVKFEIPIEETFHIIPQVDFLHLMSIDNLGTQGDNFEPRTFDKIKKVREKFPQILISVDGGIDISNYRELERSGVDRLIVGSHFKDLWKSLTKN